MAYYASPDVQVFFGAGSPLTDITAWCTGPIPMGGQGIYVDATPYGATAVVNQPVGMTDDADVVIEGLFDPAASRPARRLQDHLRRQHVGLHAAGGLRPGQPVAGHGDQLVHIGSYEVLSEVKNVVKFRATLKAAGATTWT